MTVIKSLLLKRSLTLKPLLAVSIWIERTVMKTEAKTR